jgi:hypothetical protein
MAKISSQIGKHSLQITLTDENQRSSSETIQLKVINDPPVFAFGQPKSQMIMMNKATTYGLPTYFDLEMLPVTVTHTKLPPFCSFSEDVYQLEPITHLG